MVEATLTHLFVICHCLMHMSEPLFLYNYTMSECVWNRVYMSCLLSLVLHVVLQTCAHGLMIMLMHMHDVVGSNPASMQSFFYLHRLGVFLVSLAKPLMHVRIWPGKRLSSLRNIAGTVRRMRT